MKTTKEFNDTYEKFISDEGKGLKIEIPSVIEYVNHVFKDLIKIEGFECYEIRTHFGMTRVKTNLDELLPFVGRIMHQELEEKINFILKVEYEVERRLLLIPNQDVNL